MVSIPHTTSYYLQLLCFLLLGLIVVGWVEPTETPPLFVTAFQDDATEAEQPAPAQPDAPETLTATSSQTFSFDDVYQIEINMDTPGDIEIVAVDSEDNNSNTISVTLEKRGLAHNPILTKTYLQGIALTGTKRDGTLLIDAQLLEETPEETQQNLKEQLRLNYAIKTPADVSVQLNVKTGDVRLHHLRGKIAITTGTGSVHLDEISGNYNINVTQGSIHGKILLTRGQNRIKTEEGSIELILLDGLASPMDLTAHGGAIRLHVHENYTANVEFKSQKQRVIISLPAEIENNMAFINGGGPLLRLTATDAISILKRQSSQNGTPATSPTPPLAEGQEEADILVAPAQVVPQTLQAPIIDGNLSEKVWETAAALSPFQFVDSDELPENRTELFLMSDAENFYIGAKAYFPDYQIPRISQTQHDSPIWEDEAVEILLDPNPQTSPYYHFVFNPIGAFFDQQVISPGPPNFRFAPADVKRDSVRRVEKTETGQIQPFVADSDWNSGANVATQINATFWSLEVAIPRSALKADTKNTWFFNAHRKAQASIADTDQHTSTAYREYSAWLPLYDVEHPWWPHWAETLGALTLTAAQPPAAVEKLAVAAIKIEGNTTIPSEVVLKHLPIAPGDTVTNTQLAWLIAELESNDWFQEVRLETMVATPDPLETPSTQLTEETAKVEATSQLRPEDSMKVDLHIRVIETPVKFVRKIDIEGNSGFPTLFIKRWFDLSPGYVALANAQLKQQMIADFYANRGYTFATVTHLFDNDTLQFTISEGSLDEIRFTGNRRISRSALTAALDLNLEDVYYHALGESKIELMRKKLRRDNKQFKSVRGWRIQREGGKNILIVNIVEQPFAKYSGAPIVGFNRVHGLVLGGSGTLATQLIGGNSSSAQSATDFPVNSGIITPVLRNVFWSGTRSNSAPGSTN